MSERKEFEAKDEAAATAGFDAFKAEARVASVPMPEWQELPVVIKRAWVAAAKAIVSGGK